MLFKNFGRLTVIALAAGVILAAPACFAKQTKNKQTHEKDVVATIAAREDCKIFCKALKESGISKTLEGKGPYTVFAPNDQAVRQWQKKMHDYDIWPSNEEFHKQLKYHVIPRKIAAADIKSDGSLKTVEGESVMTQVKDDTIWLDGSKVLQTDIPCSNGELFIVDTMLAPERGK